VLDGRLDGLPSGLTDATPEESAGAFLHATLSDQVAGLQAADVMLRTEQPDAVHQVRVAARRLRSTLAAFHPLMDETTVRRLRDELSWLGGQLAEARDAEVALEHLRALVKAEPEELVLGPVAARLQQAELRDVPAGVDRAHRTLSEPRYLRLLDDLHAFLASPPFTPGAEEPLRPVLRDTTQRSVKRLRRRMKAARQAEGHARTEALHGVRKAAKRARYAAEVGSGELAHVKALARSAKWVQQVLGELQDTVVTREQCRRLGLAAFAAGENAFTYGLLHGLEQGRAARAEAEFWAGEHKVRRVLKAAE
jgi:CHAD domain-containing protein